MPLLQGDIRFARSVNMADVPEGGGPPSAQLLTSGRSNEICPDISEETRTVGRTEIYQIHGLLRNTDRAALLGDLALRTPMSCGSWSGPASTTSKAAAWPTRVGIQRS